MAPDSSARPPPPPPLPPPFGRSFAAAAAAPGAWRDAALQGGCKNVDDFAIAPPRIKTIYDVRSGRRRGWLLALMSAALTAMPLSDAIYFPSLGAIGAELGAPPALAVTSVFSYMFAVGASSLLWGPLSDWVGRRASLYGAFIAFIAASLACAFSPNIGALVALRAAQGAAAAALSVNANAVVADVFPPGARGKSMGAAALLSLAAPVLAPVLGGALASAYGWRSTFFAAATLGALLLTATALSGFEETHHYSALQRVRRVHGDAIADAVEGAAKMAAPALQAPHKQLLHLCDRTLVPSVAATVVITAAMYSVLISMPLLLEAPPYEMSATLVGVGSLAQGAGCLAAALPGGALADYAARRWGRGGAPAGRVAPGAAAMMLLMPLGALPYAWGLQAHVAPAGPIAATAAVGASMSVFFPAAASLISIVKQRHVGAALGGLQALQFVVGGALVQLTPLGIEHLGVGWFFTLLAALTAGAAGAVLGTAVVDVRRSAAAAAAQAAAAPPPREPPLKDVLIV